MNNQEKEVGKVEAHDFFFGRSNWNLENYRDL